VLKTHSTQAFSTKTFCLVDNNESIILMASHWEAHSSWEAYLKAADQASAPDSDLSTATGASATSLGSPVSDSVPIERNKLARTPLSSKAKPFKSSLDRLSSQAYPGNSNGHAGSRVKWVPMFVVGGVGSMAAVDYSEEVQEDVYVSQEGPDLQPYSETLQEDVYLGGMTLPAKSTTSLAMEPANEIHFPPPQMRRGRAVQQTEDTFMTRTPSRTPSPSPVDTIAFAATKFLSFAADAITATIKDFSQADPEPEQGRNALDTGSAKSMPVKHTFIHYDTVDSNSELSSADDWEPNRLSKSASAPSIMLRDAFHEKVRLAMPELHARKECNPCAYFYVKKDGCRWGEDCKFCHMCPADEIKRRKKEKNKAKRLLKLEAAEASEIGAAPADEVQEILLQ
jgi:hypothetical protein